MNTTTISETADNVVEIRNLSRRFGDTAAVSDLSLAFPAGTIVGFIGPNGAGKSTTMRILATLDLPTAGTCQVAGLDCSNDADRVRRLIGYMPDNYGAYPDMTVRDYLDFFARAYGLIGATRQRTVDGIVEFCQLGGLMDKPVAGLSKGMKQRLCLGRCLINDPKVLILDEPTAGLDPRARIEFRDLIRALAAQGRAILISSHILSELEEVCDQVVIIERGRLVTSGTVAAVKARARAAARAAGTPPTPADALDSVAAAATATITAPADRRVRCELRLVADPTWHDEAVQRILAQEPHLSEVQAEGHGCWTGLLIGDPTEQARCLARLVTAGLPIHHFAARSENLEDAFMRLTEGTVQ
jgi:ABC-2 type transport system ATP-binding protein